MKIFKTFEGTSVAQLNLAISKFIREERVIELHRSAPAVIRLNNEVLIYVSSEFRRLNSEEFEQFEFERRKDRLRVPIENLPVSSEIISKLHDENYEEIINLISRNFWGKEHNNISEEESFEILRGLQKFMSIALKGER